MNIKVEYVENGEDIRFERYDNLILSEEAIDKIRRA